MSDHFTQEGFRGVFFEQIGISHGRTNIFRVKLNIIEVKWKENQEREEKT